MKGRHLRGLSESEFHEAIDVAWGKTFDIGNTDILKKLPARIRANALLGLRRSVPKANKI